MSKKLFAAFMAIVALAAFATASIASAAPTITHPTGTVLAVGAGIKGSNTGELIIESSLGNVTCSSGEITGNLAANSTAGGTKVTVASASSTGTGTNGECTSSSGGFTFTWGVSGGLPWCLEATSATDEFKVRGAGCSTVSRGIKYALDFTSIGTCNYVRENAAVGTLTTDAAGEAAKISLSKQEWLAAIGNPFGCPTSEKLGMTFDLYSDNANNEPLYFSS
jgi:hypothetical protein